MRIPAFDRRRFLQLSGAGLALGSAPWLASCGGGSGTPPAPPPPGEPQTYYFNLVNARDGAEYSIVAGTRQFALVPATDAHRQAAAQKGIVVPAGTITHVAENVNLAASGPQTCYVKGKHPAEPNRWHMHSMFTHIPRAARDSARRMLTACRPGGPSLHGQFIACGGNPDAMPPQDAGADPTFCDSFMTDLKDYYEQAITMVTHHPEIGSFDATTLAYIQQNIVCNDAATLLLAFTLQNQGAASTNGGWATLVPVTDPTTGSDMIDSTGDPVYHCLYTQATLQGLAQAMQSVLPAIKNDPNLGADITDLDPSVENDSLTGKSWAIRYGSTAVTPPPASVSALKPMDAAVAQSVTARDIPTHMGFSFDLQSSAGRVVQFQVSNWYLRYLGLYARFLDAGGNPIPLANVDASVLPAHAGLQGSNTYDAYIDLVNQELVVLGIPLKTAKATYQVTIPDSATGVMLLAGGLGSGSKKYPDTIKPGLVSTAVLDLAIPGIFLVMAAASGFGAYVKGFPAEALLGVAQVFIQIVGDSIVVGLYGDTEAFKNAIQGVTTLLLKIVKNSLGSELDAFSAAVKDAFFTWKVFLTGSISTGETEGAVEDAIPFGIGLILQAVMALGTAASIVETSVETARSPWTFATTVSLTHDVTLTILPDPADVAGFPQVATGFEIIATCDNAAPRSSGRIPVANPAVGQLQYTFSGLPEGGNVTFTVSMTSADGWQCASGTTGSVANNAGAYSMTVKETLVPLTASTQYSHLRKTQMSGGVRTWALTSAKPAQPALNCDPGSVALCNLVDITLSEPFGAIGYAWQSASPGVSSYANGSKGQLYQFANISFALGGPQDGYAASRGFPEPPPRIAYDRAAAGNRGYYVDSLNGNRVRGIYLAKGAPPAFDAPGSNLSYGYFNFTSDAFLTMPNGKLVSFNGANSMMEILTPSATAVADSAAPQANTVSGIGTRDGLMDTPVCAAVTAKGTILVLEAGNNRVQAFDTSGNPVLLFAGGTAATMPLKTRDSVIYEDIVVEQAGYIYVLLLDQDLPAYVLDIYTPDGAWLCTTTDVRASRFAIDLFRNVYMLNFETLQSALVYEPSISEWIPSTP
jgi:hypothetical protein